MNDQFNWKPILDHLEKGTIRAADQDKNGNWVVNPEVKQGILASFKASENIAFDDYFVDKNNLFPQKFSPQQGVRVVPQGSTVRRGAYMAPGVIMMPPSYVNVGAFVDEGTMVDSHVLVGSCAQIGKRVHLSAGVQIGGVLEPIGAMPVIIEDDVFVGAGACIVEGMIVKKAAVIAPGVILSKGLPIYDLVNEKVLEKGSSIPEGAVIIPGTRNFGEKSWAHAQGLAKYCPLIVKYRDGKSNASLELEDILR